MKKFTDLLVHIDTLGLRSDAALIGLGAIGFSLTDPNVKSDTLYRAISAESNGDRSCDLLSFDFWRCDPPYLDPFQREMTILSAAVEDFIQYFQERTEPDVCVWLWRGGFEGTILQTTFEGLGLLLPWPYYNAKDAESFCSTAEDYFGSGHFATPHGDSPEHQMERRMNAVISAHVYYTRAMSREACA